MTALEPVLCRGIWLPAGETHLQAHIEQGEAFDGKGTYQLRKLRAALSLVPQTRRRMALDVGAHVGLWTRPMAGAFSQVFAFEPVPHHADLWHRNVEHGNATLFRVALGPHDGTLRLHLERGNSGATHHDAKREGGVTVPQMALDSYDLGEVDFLKIDCEGAEEGVLRGGERTIRRNLPLVVVEQKYDHAERAGFGRLGAVKLLESWGYKAQSVIAGDYIMAPAQWPNLPVDSPHTLP